GLPEPLLRNEVYGPGEASPHKARAAQGRGAARDGAQGRRAACATCATSLQACAVLRQTRAHASTCGSPAERSHDAAQLSATAAHAALSSPWKTDGRSMKVRVVAQISTQSCISVR